jgi:uncharacterized protein
MRIHAMLPALLPALLLLPAATAAQQAPDRPTISVSASAFVEREPDEAVIVLAVESQAPLARTAAQQNAELMQRVLDAVRRQNVPADRIRTISYQLTPEYARPERDREPPRIVSYRAVNMVQVRVDGVTRVGAIIDAALDAGANRVANLSFQLSDPDAARREALGLAMQKARADAETLAAAAGHRLGTPLNISSSFYGAPRPPPMPMARGDVMMEQLVTTPVEGGTVTVQAQVSAVYLIDLN